MFKNCFYLVQKLNVNDFPTNVYKQYGFTSETNVLWIVVDTVNFFHVTVNMDSGPAIT